MSVSVKVGGLHLNVTHGEVDSFLGVYFLFKRSSLKMYDIGCIVGEVLKWALEL